MLILHFILALPNNAFKYIHDHWMSFEGFHRLSHYGFCSIIPCSKNVVSVHVSFGLLYFYFSLIFYILGVINKTIIPLQLSDMPLFGYLSSPMQQVRDSGIMFNYSRYTLRD